MNPTMTTTVTAVSQAQSLAAIRNFVRAAVSFITYTRGLCSDNAYEQRPFLGLPLRQLIPSTPESITISEWVEKGAFDALNRNYLKELSLCVYDDECKELLESYCFGFNYSGDGQRAQMSLTASQNAEGSVQKSQRMGGRDADNFATVTSSSSTTTAITTTMDGAAKAALPAYRRRRCSKQEVQRMLKQMLERLLDVVDCLPPLLSKRVLTMRLTYYDEVTPRTYEPPCFAPASRHMLHLYQEEVKLHVHIGAMDTSHHFFSVAIRHPLLQQVQSQITEQAASSAGGQSAPLRSDPESTFSSDSTAHRAVAHADGDTTLLSKPPCSGFSRAFEGAKSESRSNAGDATVQDAEEEEDAGAAFIPGDAVSARAADDQKKALAGSRDSIRCLVQDAAASPAKRSLTQRELVYLLLACFVFSHAPSVRGGRGRISFRDVEDYRAQSCPLDVPAETARRMLGQLVSEGYLVVCNSMGKPGQQLSGRGPTPSTTEWTVPDPSLALLQQLLQLPDVTQLLTHPCHVALQELCVYLEKEENRSTDGALAQSVPFAKTARRKRARV